MQIVNIIIEKLSTHVHATKAIRVIHKTITTGIMWGNKHMKSKLKHNFVILNITKLS